MYTSILLVTTVFIIFLFLTYYLEVKVFSIPIVVFYVVFIISSYYRSDTVIESENLNLDTNIESIENNDNSLAKSNKKANPLTATNYKPIIIDSISKKIIRTSNEKALSIENKVAEKPDIPKKESTLILNELLICRGVYKRTPIKPGISFQQDVDSLFCYTKISNDGDKKGLMHVWYYDNNEVTTVKYNIKPSFNYRSWSKKTIPNSSVGDWRVDVVTDAGDVLGSRSFEIVPNL